MSEIRINMPDGTVLVRAAGTEIEDIIASWNKDLLPTVVAARINGDLLDLSRTVDGDASLEIIDIGSREGLSVLRHSISHVMAQAVQDTF
jgi:threonyl-tRNA synthetase